MSGSDAEGAREAVGHLIDEFFRAMNEQDFHRMVKLVGSGDVACFSQVMDLHTRSEDAESRLEDARLTGVAERRDRGWVLVQTHLSVPDGG